MPLWQAGMEHRCCHKEQPAQPVHSQASTCCQALGATVPTVAHAPQAELLPATFVWPAVLVLESTLDDASETLITLIDHGPPAPNLLTELLLRKSVPAHAPPVV